MKELYTKPEVKVDEYNTVDVISTSVDVTNPHIDDWNDED